MKSMFAVMALLLSACAAVVDNEADQKDFNAAINSLAREISSELLKQQKKTVLIVPLHDNEKNTAFGEYFSAELSKHRLFHQRFADVNVVAFDDFLRAYELEVKQRLTARQLSVDELVDYARKARGIEAIAYGDYHVNENNISVKLELYDVVSARKMASLQSDLLVRKDDYDSSQTELLSIFELMEFFSSIGHVLQ